MSFESDQDLSINVIVVDFYIATVSIIDCETERFQFFFSSFSIIFIIYFNLVKAF